MRRNPRFFLRFVFFAFCCFNFSTVFGQTSDRADLTGTYAGNLKFPSANLNGKATLSVEGNKFLLRNGNGSEKTGRITAIKTGGDYVSIALMFEETPKENQPFAHSMMSVRLRKTGKNLIFTSAPGEEREFRFEAGAETANNKTEKFTEARLNNTAAQECVDPKSAKCGVNFGFVGADELERAAAPKTSSVTKLKPKTNASRTKAARKTKTGLSSNFRASVPRKEPAAENKLPESPKTNGNQTPVETSNIERPISGKQTATSEDAPKTTDAEQQNNSNLDAFKQATDELRRATLELRRANDEIKVSRDELRRLRAESSSKTTNAANTEKLEKTTANNSSSAVPVKTSATSSNKTARKKAISTKSTAKKSFSPKTKSSKTSSVKPQAKKSGSKLTGSNSLTEKEPAKPTAQTENVKAPKAAETKPSPSPASSPNQKRE